MVNSILLYIVQNENEIPQQLIPNTAYYIAGREVRIVDNIGQVSTFTSVGSKNDNDKITECEKRIEVCENKLQKIYAYLTSFGGEEK